MHVRISRYFHRLVRADGYCVRFARVSQPHETSGVVRGVPEACGWLRGRAAAQPDGRDLHHELVPAAAGQLGELRVLAGFHHLRHRRRLLWRAVGPCPRPAPIMSGRLLQTERWQTLWTVLVTPRALPG